jgi:plasmid replication initiation protein
MSIDSSQFSLDLTEQTPLILKKPVQATHMRINGGQINKTQRLAWQAMLKNAHDIQKMSPDQDLEVYSISRSTLMEMIGYKSRNRKHLQDTLLAMLDLKVEWDVLNKDKTSAWGACVLMPHVEFNETQILYSFLPRMKPLLFNPEIYSRLDLRIQSSLKTDAAVALYDWCNRYRKNPSKITCEMSWEEWRWAIHGPVNETSSLNEYKFFKRDKLTSAMTDINLHSDLEVKLIEDKDGGKSVKNIKFSVAEKQVFEISITTVTNEKWDNLLLEIGVSKIDRSRIIANYSVEIIDAHYVYAMKRIQDKKQSPLKDVAAYFVNAIDSGYASGKVKPASTGSNTDIVEGIEEKYRQNRNVEASELFKELSGEQRELLIIEYNNQLEIKVAAIPPESEKRIKRMMAPFYAWYAQKTWGDPSAGELLKFAMVSGAIKLNIQ